MKKLIATCINFYVMLHAYLCFNMLFTESYCFLWNSQRKSSNPTKKEIFLNLTTSTVIGWICLQLKRLRPKKFLMAFNDLTLRSKSGSCAIDFYDVVFMQSFCWETRVHEVDWKLLHDTSTSTAVWNPIC